MQGDRRDPIRSAVARQHRISRPPAASATDPLERVVDRGRTGRFAGMTHVLNLVLIEQCTPIIMAIASGMTTGKPITPLDTLTPTTIIVSTEAKKESP